MLCNVLFKLIALLSLSLLFEAATPRHKSYFGEGTGLIFLNRVACSGNEERLIDCHHRGFGETLLCSHRDDAGVSCLRKFHCLLDNYRVPDRYMPPKVAYKYSG